MLKQWFSRKEPEPPSARERLAVLEDRLEGLSRDVKGLRLEWEETYDRVYRVLGRINARLKRQNEPEQPPDEQTEEPQGPVGFDYLEAHRRLRERRNGLLRHG